MKIFKLKNIRSTQDALGHDDFEVFIDDVFPRLGNRAGGSAVEVTVSGLGAGTPRVYFGGQEASVEDVEELLKVETDGWLAEIPQIRDYYATFGSRPNQQHSSFRTRRAAIRADDMDRALARARRSDAGLSWPQAEHRSQPDFIQAQTGYMQGAAGVGSFLLHLATTRNGDPVKILMPEVPYSELDGTGLEREKANASS